MQGREIKTAQKKNRVFFQVPEHFAMLSIGR